MIYGDNLKTGRNYTGRIYPLSFKWLHGKIEELNGCDICYCDNKKQHERYSKNEIVEDTQIILRGNDNMKVEATIFTWFDNAHSECTTGFIVLRGDKLALKEVRESYNKRGLK